jgi:hypothetical protein
MSNATTTIQAHSPEARRFYSACMTARWWALYGPREFRALALINSYFGGWAPPAPFLNAEIADAIAAHEADAIASFRYAAAE